MAYSCGFFNSKGLDRTYTAEDFTTYLSSIICNGILDTYGKCFELTAMPTGLRVRLGTGKAWINGHYFVNDASQTIDLKEYQDESLPRYVGIAIVCDVSEEVRDVYLEITPGTPAEYPSLPTYPKDANKTRLLMYGVRLNVGADSLTERDWYDYREDGNVCGYCRCILGKCKVTDMLSQLAELTALIDGYKKAVEEYVNKIEVLQTKVDDLTGDVVEAGQCGEDIYYVIYSNGKVLLRGSGEMYDYDLEQNKSPFYKNNDLKSLVVSDGITTIGDMAFENCENLLTASLPATLKTIGRACFMQGDDRLGYIHGLESITIPNGVETIERSAFWGTAIKELVIPASVKEIGEYVCRDCYVLKAVRIEGKVVGGFMFTSCSSLQKFSISAALESFGANALNYCKNLKTIDYEGSLEQWQAIPKGTSWDGHGGSDAAQSGLTKIQCIDGFMEYDAKNREWKVGEE